MQHQKQSYEVADVFSSYFVFASAGSGKTKTLVDRYVKSMFFGIKPQEILCLTFTNAAVFEMQSRISKILEKLCLNKDQYTQNYLRETLQIQNITESDINKAENLFFEFQDNLQNLKILTIHAFCQSLLQKFPMESGINPNFEIIDENEAFKLLKTAKQNALKKIPEELINCLSKIMSLHSFEDFIERIYSESDKFNEFFSRNPDILKYQKDLEKLFKISHITELTKCQEETVMGEFGSNNYEELFLTKTGTIRKKLPKSKVIAEIAEIIYNNSVEQKKQTALKKTLGFLDIAKTIFDEYQSLKLSQNAIDFTDVLIKTEYLLTKSCAKDFALSKICRQIKSIMIDEAQDLSHIQWKLISLFSEEIFTDEQSKSAIFVVGDIKQSIYRFQGANHKLFIQFYKNCMKTLNSLNKPFKTLYLNICYRSLPKILETVDSVFNGETGNFAFEEDSIDYKKHIPYRKDQDGSVNFINSEEAAETIETLVNSNGINPKDIMILTRSRTELSENITNDLMKRGIKIAPPDRIYLSLEILIMDLLALADVCIDQENDYSLACILKSSYLFENPLSNEDLLSICYNRALSVFENLETKFPKIFKYLKEIMTHYKSNNLIEFFYYISTKIVRTTNQKEKDILNAFMNEVIKHSNKNSDNIEDFLTHIRESKIKIQQQHRESNGVKLATIHGAKGLEAPIVFLLDFDLNIDKAKVKFIWKEKENDMLFFIKPSKNDSFDEIEVIMNEEYTEENKELLRLLYVAMTRPRDILYFLETKYDKGAFNLVMGKIS